MTKLFDLSGRIAVVTGSAQGMGRAMATALAEAGANLVLLDRNAAGIEATAQDLGRFGGKTLPIAGDVTDTDHLDRVFETVDHTFGRVDILGNVAGEARMGSAEEMALEDIRATFHNLVISRYYTCQLAGRRMLAQGRGCIISIGSIAGVSSLGRAQSVYGMAMAAVIQMTRELSTEWVARGVRVNCILPAQVLGANGLRPAHGRRPVATRNISARHPGRAVRPARRHQGPVYAAGLGRVRMDHRRHHSDGWRQPGDERRRWAARPDHGKIRREAMTVPAVTRSR